MLWKPEDSSKIFEFELNENLAFSFETAPPYFAIGYSNVSIQFKVCFFFLILAQGKDGFPQMLPRLKHS